MVSLLGDLLEDLLRMWNRKIQKSVVSFQQKPHLYTRRRGIYFRSAIIESLLFKLFSWGRHFLLFFFVCIILWHHTSHRAGKKTICLRTRDREIKCVTLTSPRLMKLYRPATLCAVWESTFRRNRTKNELVKMLSLAALLIVRSSKSPGRLDQAGIAKKSWEMFFFTFHPFNWLEFSIFSSPFSCVKNQYETFIHKKKRKMRAAFQYRGYSYLCASWNFHSYERTQFLGTYGLLVS